MRPQEFIRLIKSLGWYVHRQTGSHIHFRHPERTDTLVVPYHAGREIPTGLAHSLLKQAGLK